MLYMGKSLTTHHTLWLSKAAVMLVAAGNTMPCPRVLRFQSKAKGAAKGCEVLASLSRQGWGMSEKL